MKLEILEEHVPSSPGQMPPRRWDVRDEHGRTLATVYDESFVRYLENAEVVNNYVADAVRTESRLEGGGPAHQVKLRILHAAMGFGTETGEFTDELKKHNFYGADLNLATLDEEVGDLLWYTAIYLDVRGKTFPEIMAANICKLRARYPEKFTKDKAASRNLVAEQAAMQQSD